LRELTDNLLRAARRQGILKPGYLAFDRSLKEHYGKANVYVVRGKQKNGTSYFYSISTIDAVGSKPRFTLKFFINNVFTGNKDVPFLVSSTKDYGTLYFFDRGFCSREIFEFMLSTLGKLADETIDRDALLQLVLDTGKFGVDAMALLDKANTGTYGSPRITKVRTGVRDRPGILISGHDLHDLYDLLEQTKGTGIDILYSRRNAACPLHILSLKNTTTSTETMGIPGGTGF